MNMNCLCGGRLRRTDIRRVDDPNNPRILFMDLDNKVAHFKCNKCGIERTQKKRQPGRKRIPVPPAAFEGMLKFFEQITLNKNQINRLLEKVKYGE